MSLTRRATIVRLLLAAAIVAAGAGLPLAGFALSLETAPTNPDGTSKFADPDQKLQPFDYRSLSNHDSDNNDSNNQPRGLTFGSPNSGPGSFSFTVGPVQQSNSPFDNSRFFRPGPPSQ